MTLKGKGGFFWLLALISYRVFANDLYQQLLLSYSCNQIKQPEIIYAIKTVDGRLALEEQSLKTCGINSDSFESLVFNDKAYLLIDRANWIKYKLDYHRMHIDLELQGSALKSDQFDLSEFNSVPIRPNSPGVYLNYDLTGQHFSGESNLFSGLFDLVHFNKLGIFETDFIFNNKCSSCHEIVRLNSQWIYQRPEKMDTFQLGDSVILNNIWSFPARFGGFSYFTNFDTQPSFDPMPQPAVQGIANVPSRVDVYLENQLLTTQEVDSGPFKISAVPVVNQAGEMVVKTKDLLNRETVLVIPYYSSSRLLRVNLSRSAYHIGFERRNYGLQGFDYGRFFLSYLNQKGISEKWTFGEHLELLSHQQTFGIDSTSLLGNWLELSLFGAGSYDSKNFGYLDGVGVQRKTSKYSLGFNAAQTSLYFKQIGIDKNVKPSALFIQSFVSYNNNLGTFSASYNFTNERDNSNLKLIIFNYYRTLLENIYFYVNASEQQSFSTNRVIYLGLTWSPQPTYTLSSYAERANNQYRGLVEISKNVTKDNSFGYRVAKEVGNSNFNRVEGEMLSSHGYHQVKYENSNRGDFIQADTSGSIVYFNDYFGARQKIDNSFILVKTLPLKKVDIYYQNQIVGQLDSNGYYFIENALPYQKNKVDLDYLDLPLTSKIENYSQIVYPYYRSGTLLRYDVKNYLVIRFNLVDEQKNSLPAGSTVKLNSGQTFAVGYNGRVFLELEDQIEELEGTAESHSLSCNFNIKIEMMNDLNTITHGVDLGEVICIQ